MDTVLPLQQRGYCDGRHETKEPGAGG